LAEQLERHAAIRLFTAVKMMAAFAVLMTMVAYIVLVERRLCAFIQDRVGRTASARSACCNRRRTR